MRECPRFISCSVNHCPLDPGQSSAVAHPDDQERKCTMEKNVRLRIGQQYPDLLPGLGLTKAERSAQERQDQMTPDQRAAQAERGRAALMKLRNPA